MNINHIKQALGVIAENDGVPFIIAQPGVGKSDGVKQFAQDQAKKLGLEFYEGPENYSPDKFGFLDLRLATIDSIELSGLPLIDASTERTKFTRSPYIPEDGYGILFLDELPQAKAGNQASVSQLILDKRVGTHALGKNWVIIAAGNRVEDRAATHKMPTHIANRLTTLKLDFSSDALVKYMLDTGVHESAIAFVKRRPDVLESFKADEAINCTPRSFISATAYINSPEEIRFSLISGTIGEGAASEFIGFINIYKGLNDFNDFLANPGTIKIPEKTDVMFATIEMLAHNSTVDNIEKVNKFISRLEDEPERQVQFWKSVMDKTPGLSFSKELMEFTKKNPDLLY